MQSGATVAHDGVIEAVSGKNVRVRFVAHSACAACHAKGVCSVSDSEEKFVDLVTPEPGLKAGDRVDVLLAQSQGFKAVWYGYGLPLIVLLAVIFTVYAVTGRDAFAALIGLGSLVPYYLVLFVFRTRITRSMEFKLRKQNQ
jgi:positive regulator of sigma E activity